MTCPDTFATSYELQATSDAGAVAALAEWKKMTKYETTAQTDLFYPIAIETSGVFGPVASTILCDLARQIKDVSNDACMNQTQGHTCSKKFLLRCRGAMQHLSRVVLV